jgi:hypothetical protein
MTQFAKVHPDQQLVREIEKRIFDATADCGFFERLDALVGMFTFHMSMVCPECRRALASELERRIPGMIEMADFCAAGGPNGPNGECEHNAAN